MATVKDVMNYFDYKTTPEFQKDWKSLTEEEKKYFRDNTPETPKK